MKVLKKPKFECELYKNEKLCNTNDVISVGRLLEMHGEGTTRSTGTGTTTGTKVDRDDYEPPVQTSV